MKKSSTAYWGLNKSLLIPGNSAPPLGGRRFGTDRSEGSRVGNNKIREFTVGAWLVEPDLCRLSSKENQVTLQARWMDVLVYLAENAGNVVSTEDIIENVWGNLDASHDSVYVTVSHLRKELAQDQTFDSYIQTIAGRGYRLAAPVEMPEIVAAESRRKALIAAGAVVGVIVAGLASELWNEDADPVPVPNSIAVLPFDDLQPEANTDYALGFVDNLIVKLDRIDGLEIMGRTSSLSMDARQATVQEIGAELGVSTVLEGSLRREGNGIEVMAQLIRTDSGLHIWADTYRMDVGAVNRIQTDIARQVAEGLGFYLPPEYLTTLNSYDVPIVLQTRVNTYTDNNQEWPHTLALPDGGHLIAWRSTDQDGSHWGIYAQRYDASGARAGPEFRTHTTTREGQYLIDTATNPDGGFAAVWNSWEADGIHWGVMGRLFGTQAEPSSPEFVVNDYGDKEQSSATIAALPDGRFGVAYQSKSQAGPGYEIFIRMFSADGSPEGPSVQVNSFASNNQGKPRIANLGSDRLFVTWDSIGVDGSAHGVAARVLNSNGEPAGSELVVNSYFDHEQISADVVGLTGGGAVVVWQSQGQDSDGVGGWGIFGQRIDANGVKVGLEFSVNSFTREDQSLPIVTAMPDGGFFVVWMSDGQIASGMDIFGQRFDAEGQAVGGELFVNVITNSYQRKPSPATLRDGSVVVAFQADDWDGSKFGIFSRRLVFSELSGDALVGKQSGDTFVFEKRFERKSILAFDPEIDRIDISALGVGFDDLAFEQSEAGIAIDTGFGLIFVQSVSSLEPWHFLM